MECTGISARAGNIPALLSSARLLDRDDDFFGFPIRPSRISQYTRELDTEDDTEVTL